MNWACGARDSFAGWVDHEMALKVFQGVIDQLGPASPLGPDGAPTGTEWAFVRLNRASRKPVKVEQVVADLTIGACIAVRQTGRFAFYLHDHRRVLCGFAGPAGIEIATLANDPEAIAAAAVRLPA